MKKKKKEPQIDIVTSGMIFLYFISRNTNQKFKQNSSQFTHKSIKLKDETGGGGIETLEVS